MKKVTYLLLLMFATVLLTTSCEEEEPLTKGMVVNDLVGDWEFKSLEFNDTTYSTHDKLSKLNLKYDFVQLDFSFDTDSVELSTKYLNETDNNNSWSHSYSFTFDGKIINIKDDYLKFEIQDIDNFNGEKLILKLINGNKNMPLDGKYKLQKNL